MEEIKETVAAEVAEEKTYTEKELQSFVDRRVTEALKTARTKFESEKKEAERLASMSAEERFQEELSKREKALEERERQVALLENRNAASKILADKGISISLVDLVIADSAEDMKARIDTLEKEFNASVQKEIERRLAGSTPAKVTTKEGMTKEEFNKLSLAKQQQLFKSNPDLYKALTQCFFYWENLQKEGYINGTTYTL